jgi:hypothetical protein
MAVETAREGYELWRPHREKAESKTTRVIVAIVLLSSAGLIALIVLGGWERLQSQSVGIITLAWAGLYVLFAILVLRWNRGVLPVAAALAIIMAIFAGLSAPAWFDRSKPGLSGPALPDDLLGLLCLIVIPAQLLLIAVAMVGFNQNWHVEEERPIGGYGEPAGAPVGVLDEEPPPGGYGEPPGAPTGIVEEAAAPANRPEFTEEEGYGDEREPDAQPRDLRAAEEERRPPEAAE